MDGVRELLNSQTKVTFHCVRFVIRLFNRMFEANKNSTEATAFCHGFILAMSMFTDLSVDNAAQLSGYVRKKNDG